MRYCCCVLQHAYVFSERVTPEQPLSKGASIRSEVTLDNPTGKTWSGHISAKIWPVERPTCKQDAAVPKRQQCDSQATAKHADLEAGCSASDDTAVVQWAERLCVPPGSTVHSLKTCLIEKPALWWPMHLGDQVTQSSSAPCHRVPVVKSGVHLNFFGSFQPAQKPETYQLKSQDVFNCST